MIWGLTGMDDSREMSYDELRRLSPRAITVELPADAIEWIRTLHAVRAMRHYANKIEAHAETHLAPLIGDASTATIAGEIVLTWKDEYSHSPDCIRRSRHRVMRTLDGYPTPIAGSNALTLVADAGRVVPIEDGTHAPPIVHPSQYREKKGRVISIVTANKRRQVHTIRRLAKQLGITDIEGYAATVLNRARPKDGDIAALGNTQAAKVIAALEKAIKT